MRHLAAGAASPANLETNRSALYQGFISYSHAADGKLAPALQLGLHRFAKPWYRLRALRVFRDEASLSANPGLWSSIETALASSEFFILLASPEAAGSRWVGQEVEFWRANKPLENILIVLTGGDCVWDEARGGFDPDRTTALPAPLAAAFVEEPRFIDLRWAQTADDLSLRNVRFRDRVADLAAPLHGRPKDELIGEDVRQHRRTVRVARGAAAALLVLTAAAIGLAGFALIERSSAIAQRDRARSDELASEAVAGLGADPEQSVALALKATDLARTPQSEAALRQALGASRFRATLGGHEGRVTSAMFSHDSALVLTASADGTARVWEAATGRALQVMRAGRGAVVRASFGARGTRVLTVGANGAARLWRTSGRSAGLLQTEPHAGGIASFSPDGRFVVTGGPAGSARVWDAASGKPVAAFRAVGGAVTAAAFSPDSVWFATGSRDGTARVWLTSGGEPTAVLHGHAARITSISFSPDGRLVLTTDEDGSSRIWSAATGRLRAVIGDEADGFATTYSAVFSPDGARVLTLGEDEAATTGNGGTASVPVVAVWPAQHPVDPTVVGGDRVGVTVHEAAFSPDGRLVVTASDRTAVVADAASGTVRSVLRGHTDQVETVGFSPDGTLVLTVSADGTARLWHATTGKPVAVLRGAEGERVTGAAFSPNGRAVVTITGSRAEVWDVAGAQAGVVLSRERKPVNDAAFSPDGRLVATASDDGTARLWRVATGEQVGALRGSDPVETVSFSRDGHVLVAAEPHGARVWHFAGDGHATMLDPDVSGDVTGAAISPDGASVAVASAHGSVDRTEIANRGILQSWHWPPSVRSVAIGPGGRFVAFGGSDGRIGLADTRNPAVDPVPIEGAHAGAVNSVAFSRDGRYLVSAGDDEKVTRLGSTPPRCSCRRPRRARRGRQQRCLQSGRAARRDRERRRHRPGLELAEAG